MKPVMKELTWYDATEVLPTKDTEVLVVVRTTPNKSYMTWTNFNKLNRKFNVSDNDTATEIKGIEWWTVAPAPVELVKEVTDEND